NLAPPWRQLVKLVQIELEKLPADLRRIRHSLDVSGHLVSDLLLGRIYHQRHKLLEAHLPSLFVYHRIYKAALTARSHAVEIAIGDEADRLPRADLPRIGHLRISQQEYNPQSARHNGDGSRGPCRSLSPSRHHCPF